MALSLAVKEGKEIIVIIDGKEHTVLVLQAYSNIQARVRVDGDKDYLIITDQNTEILPEVKVTIDPKCLPTRPGSSVLMFEAPKKTSILRKELLDGTAIRDKTGGNKEGPKTWSGGKNRGSDY